MEVQDATPRPKRWSHRTIEVGLVMFVSFIVVGLSYIWIQQTTVIWSGSCAPTGLTAHQGITVDCNGKSYEVNDRRFVISYAINPGPVQCSLFANGSIGCQNRPFK